jgi:hypothetical protein
MSKFAPRSTSGKADPKNPQPMLELIQQDLRDLARIVNTSQKVYLTAPDRIAIPLPGVATVYLLTDTATASSTNVDYHTIVAKRSGQAEGQVSIDTRLTEMSAFKPLYCGTFEVGQGDVLSYTLTVGGAPVPTLTASNLTMLCVLTALETV